MSDDEADPIFISFHPLLILSLILTTAQVIAGGTTPQTDREVLLKLKRFLQFNNKVTQGLYTQWTDSSPSHCSWSGITCNSDNHVTGISLTNSNISGGIFAAFSSLSELAYLDLSQNTISGPIPADLNKCHNLQYLNLSHNIIEGELNLTGLNNLETVDVTLNRFNGSIHTYFPGMCSNLVLLNLSMNSFSGEITETFDTCLRLRYVDLSANSFNGFIWSGFPTLLEFSASENNFTGMITPETFPRNCSLQTLDLSSNSFQGAFPDSVSNCSRLTYLSLWGNHFTSTVPAGIGSLVEINTLILGNNSFHRDIPNQLLSCPKLAFLDLSSNNFRGEVQDIFGKFTAIKFLVLHSNNYTGGIQSSGILKLLDLERLDLSYNYFSGQLPGMAALTKLKFLILAFNKFSGSIPPEYGTISSLQAMDLSFNQLTGTIPPAIGNLTSLLWLMLANNQLTGEIPPHIGNCSSLMWLNLANNQLSGNVPTQLMEVGRNPNPTFEANRRPGGVAPVSGECLIMKRLLPANYPPFSFVYTLMTRKRCRTIWELLLKGDGFVPLCMNSTSPTRTLATSGYLQLSGNHLSGEVPQEINKLKTLSMLDLANNRFSGQLPPEIGQLPLVFLNGSHNNFSGEIPQELGNLKCLNSLDLSYNNFSGGFQEGIGAISELEKLNLSYNPLLSGVIPVTGQLATFDNNSFIADPLVYFFNSKDSNPLVPVSTHRKGLAKTTTYWVFLALAVIFFTSGILFLVFCSNARLPVAQDPEQGIDSMSGDVKVFRLGKVAAFTFSDILMATKDLSEEMVVGRGGSGVVYRGVLPDGRKVAVKKLSRGDGEGEREFRAEMEALAGGGKHPNVVSLFGWCLSGAEKLLVYEYMEGGNLEEVIADWRRFGWQWRVKAAVGVARGLVYLHYECQPAIVHRDVKASNVMLDSQGWARVTDFGLARLVGAGATHVSTVVAGTVGYVAPEYGHTWRATTRGDVYSFGVLVMELATGRRALDGGEECLVDWVRQVAQEGWQGLRGAVVPVMISAAMREGDEDSAGGGGGRKTFWRSASWSSSRTAAPSAADTRSANGGRPPATPRSNSTKSRSCLLPPLQPLSITRRSLDEWPSASSDDVGEWPLRPPTPGGGAAAAPASTLDITSLVKKDQIAFFDKECSKVADHIYLGGDSVARNREILRQHGITHVLNCVGFVCPEYFKSDLTYKTLWLQDNPAEDITSILYDVFDYFEDVRENAGRVFVHCCQGVSRSTSLVIAYLMWREGQSFDDAFQFVKAARRIANPNMGFACQLLQCQKRVHAIPLSPNSVLRMYRMAPHSPYDPLHLVPRTLNDPTPSALDSRGAFILHIPTLIYVWIGNNCESIMEKDAKAAAFQVVRYERVPGPIISVEEGREPADFWDAFINAPLGLNTTVPKVNREDIDSAIKIGAGKRKVDAYDVDFELFYKAITGGVVPPFPSSGPGHETHLPARESNWSVLRRKFLSLARDVDHRTNRVQILSAEVSTSPHLSPSSLSSDSSITSKDSLDSPSFSPSTSSSWSPGHPPNLSITLEPLTRCMGAAASSPSKGLSRSIAERRGSFSPLKLPALGKDASLPGMVRNESHTYLVSPREALEASSTSHILSRNDSDNSLGRVAENSSSSLLENGRSSSSSGSTFITSESLNTLEPLVLYQYPNMEKVALHGREELDSKTVFLLLTQNTGNEEEPGRKLYLWIGSTFEQRSGHAQLKSGRVVDKVGEIDWNHVGLEFLASMSLPKDTPIKVVKEQEPEEFLELLNL